jgi:hypothetical protein
VEGSVLSSSLSSLWPTFVGLFACSDIGPCPLFPFLSLHGSFLSIKFGRVSSIRFAHVHTHCALELYWYWGRIRLYMQPPPVFWVTTPATKAEISEDIRNEASKILRYYSQDQTWFGSLSTRGQWDLFLLWSPSTLLKMKSLNVTSMLFRNM